MSNGSIGNYNFGGGTTYSLSSLASRTVSNELTEYDEIDYGVSVDFVAPKIIIKNGKIEVDVNKSGAKISFSKLNETLITKSLATFSKFNFSVGKITLGDDGFAKVFGNGKVGSAVAIGAKSSVFLEGIMVFALSLHNDGIDIAWRKGLSTTLKQGTKSYGSELQKIAMKNLLKKIDAYSILDDETFERVGKRLGKNAISKLKGLKVGAAVLDASSLAFVNAAFDFAGNFFTGLIGKDKNKDGEITAGEWGLKVAWEEASSNCGKSLYKGVVTTVFQVAGGLAGGKVGKTIGGYVGAAIAGWTAEFFSDDKALLVAAGTTFAGLLIGVVVVNLWNPVGWVGAIVVVAAAFVGWIVGVALDSENKLGWFT